MSYFETTPPICSAADDELELIIRPERKDLGDFSVARALPAPERQSVGPFVFFDHMGPADLPPGKGMQVRPHPHIGIAAITYLFEGAVVHRDSLGNCQSIEPGAVNLMIAGRGIVHSERAGDDFDRHSRLHGFQCWLALPDRELECEPSFTHYPAESIPEMDIDGVRIRLIAGQAFGEQSPVTLQVPTLYFEADIPEGGSLVVPASVPELAAYLVSGSLVANRCQLNPGVMAVACTGSELELIAQSDTRVMIVGGESVGHRELWWNFVAPNFARIEQAKSDWRAGNFADIVGDDEFIPLPEA